MNRFNPIIGLPASGGKVKACGEPGRSAVSICGLEGPVKQELGCNYSGNSLGFISTFFDDRVRL